MAYTGSPLDLGLAKTANAANWYDSALYSNIVDIDYKSQTIQNAGTYQVKLTIKSDKNYVWSDSNGISDKERTINFVVNPAKITIQNGKQSELENGYEYVYHTDGHSKHALCFPKPADGGIYNKNYINLNAVGGDDENNVKIYYHIETHAEKDHQNFVDNLLPSLKDSVKTLPDNNDAKTGWAEYTEGDSTLNVNDVQGYCVFYKVTAPNHETLYGYFSVHIITEILTIDTSSSNLNSSEIQYGSKDVPYKQADLKKLAEAIITSVKDQNNEERYKDMPEGSGLDKSKFIFYLKRTDDGSDKVINTTEDEVTGSSHWDAGKYELYVKYVDGDNSQFISFNWSGTRPVLTISPKSVTLTWKGNASWETDKAKASETVADSMDEFSWVYDGDPHCPTATYQNISDSEETLTITGDYKNADSYTATAPDVANYTFTNKTRQFKIVKAKNGWQDGKGYENRQWSIGATPTEEFIPTDIFGNKATVSYWKKYEEDSNTFSEQYFGDFTDIKEPTIIYVKVSAVSSDGNKNYDAIVVKAEIHIIECIAHQPSDVIQHDASGHWQVCKFCNTKLGDTQPHTSKSYLSDESQHWQICETCHEEFGRDSHVAKVGDNALGHDPDQHWNICATCNEEYNKVGHTFDNAGNVTKQPKCNEFGEQEFSCECGEKDPVLHQVAKTEHNYSEDWVTSEGSSQHWHECSVCHDKKEFTDHVYSEAGQITQEADCTTAGKREYKCICGAIQEREIAAKGHTAKEGWQSDGTQHWQVCATCSEIIEESRKNHSWGELVPEVQPTCTKSGHTEYYKCSECQKLKDGYKDEDIDPIPHTFGADKVRTEPTCTKQGSETGTCELCHNKVTNIIPATGHSYAEKIEREATCSLEGSKIEECTSCHEMKPDSRVSIPKTAHTYAEKIETAATCTAPGSKIEECTACHEMKPDSRTSIPMLDHSYGSWNTVLAASCSAEGKEERTCASCGGKEERALQRLAHTMQHHDEKAATETAAGNIDYYECSKCHKFFGDANGGTELSATDIVIPALGLGNGNGMDTGSGSGGDEGFFQKNWWWIVLIVAAVLLVMMLIFFISSSISRRRERERERERDRQLETLLKMQMMHYGFGGGMGGYQNSAENDMAFAEKQQPAQLPYTQEMIDVAVAAAMSAMQRMNAEKPEDQTPPPDDGGNGGGFDDDFGFYDEYKP